MSISLLGTRISRKISRQSRWYQLLSGAALCILSTIALGQQEVEQWKQFRVSMQNQTWNGNPYDLILTGRFTHDETGEEKTQFGFYAGNDTWSIYFMPDRTGAWSYVTESSDSDLGGLSGSFEATAPSITGPIRPVNRHWQFGSGEAISPTILAVGPYVRSRPVGETQELVDWANNVAGATYLGTTLLNFSGDTPFTDSQEDRMYVDGSGEGVDFFLPAWDRSNEFYDLVRDTNMGHYILIYSDDGSNPNNHGLPENSDGTVSNAELRLFRYLVARFSPYPKVIWDSGIDINESRSNPWINNFVAWFQSNDPWRHPISSRTTCCGTGGTHPDTADFYSNGERTLPSRVDLIDYVVSRSEPTAMTDRYRENYSSPFDGDRNKVREAAWQMILTYGTGVYFGGNENGGYLGSTYATDLEAAPDLGKARKFLNSNLIDLAKLVPNDDLVLSGDAWLATDNINEYVVYSRSGPSFTLSFDLDGRSFSSYWYDPVSGVRIDSLPLSGNGPFEFSKPGNNSLDREDWVLHIVAEGSITRPNPVTNLRVE